MKKFRWILLLAAAAVLLLPACSQPKPRPAVLAPDFTLPGLDGGKVTLSSYQGKVVFLNFWATWCPPCREEMPEIEAVYQQYKSRDVVVIGVDLLEPAERVRQFVQEGGYSWTFAIDTSGAVAKLYNITSIPTSYFIDRKGFIRAAFVGGMSRKGMASFLDEAMKGAP